MNKIKKGFTLIELLIVIALLGALAVALLAALDPLEQIKKGTDTGVRNTVSEISGSFTRYASVKSGAFPFVLNAPILWAAIGKSDGTPAQITTVGQVALDKVIQTGELKSDFFTLAGDQLDKIFIVGEYSDSIQKFYVCYKPTAKSFRADANTKYVIATPASDVAMTETATACDPTTGQNGAGLDCYWCAQQ